MTRPSPFTALRLCYGAVLLARPRALLEDAGLRADRHAVLFARVLGARHATEALLMLASGHPWPRAAAAVDGVHAATALAWAALDERHRRGLALNAAVAATLAATGIRLQL